MPIIETHRVLLSLTDIAALSGVQRPVVSVWRSRSRHSDVPFPDPISSVRGQPRFAAADVVSWLDATGRGNNPESAADAAVFGVPEGISEDDEQALGDGMSAVLCLKALTGQSLAGRAVPDLLALAEVADPDDEVLVREVRALDERLAPLAVWADAASDAAYSIEGAFERLVAGRPADRQTSGHRSRARGAGSSTLAGPLHRLVGVLARALSVEAGAELPRYLDATPGGSELMMTTLQSGGRDTEVDTAATVLVPDGTTPGSRGARRRLLVHGVHPMSVPTDADGRFEVREPVVQLLQLVSNGDGGTAEQMLTAVDDVQLAMDEDQRAIVVAPASILCDRLPDRQLDGLRDQLVRLGRVRAVVRLPQGLVTASPRQRLGLWVLGPAHTDVSLDMRWTSVADLSGVDLSDVVVDDLVSDLVAAMGSQAMVRSHAFRFARLRQTSAMLAGRRALVGPGASAARVIRTTPADQAVAVGELRSSLADGQPRDPLAGVRVMPARDDPVDPTISIGSAVEQSLARVVSGSRVDVDGLPEGTVPVFSVPDLLGDVPRPGRSVEVLALESAFPAARRTEPGDVVFCTSPRPRAFVDVEGGSVVAYPARVLRVVDPASTGLVSQVLATDINLLPHTARAWRTWPVRRVPRGQVAAVAAALVSLQSEETRARHRAVRIATLTQMVLQGVTARALTLAVTDDVIEYERRS
jgi:hypothetical protein